MKAPHRRAATNIGMAVRFWSARKRGVGYAAS
jgi:hypothetical protein